jgi:hypothetical protein
MISITTLTGSTDGVIFEEKESSELYRTAVRATKTKTLDGGVSIDHRGFISADNDLKIIAKVDAATEAGLQALYENETYLNLSCKSGFYKGIIADLTVLDGDVDLTFWPSE